MPIYTYKCYHCNSVVDASRKIADRKKGPDCCGEVMNQIIVPAMIQPVLGGGDFPGYQCPVTDKYITSRKQRRNVIAEHNLIEKG